MDGNDGSDAGDGAVSAPRALVGVLGRPEVGDQPAAPRTPEPGAGSPGPMPGRFRPTLTTAAAVCVIAASLSVMGWIHQTVDESAPPGGRYAVIDTPPDAGTSLPPQVRVSPQPLVPLLPPDRDGDPRTGAQPSRAAPAAPSGHAATSRPARPVTGPVGAISGYPGKCLHVPGDYPADGIPVEMRACDGSPGENWTMASDGTVRAFGKCLGVVGDQAANGTGVQLSACRGAAGQQWHFTAGRDLVNPHADKCLDVTDFAVTDGARLQVWTCVGGPNQKWSVPA
jgi:ricin-type beta-trefoil lectin protein